MIPLRARGIVTLTKVVHGIPRAKMVSMMMIQEGGQAAGGGEHQQVLQDVLDILIRLLSEKDSFIYLAAIQALAVLR